MRQVRMRRSAHLRCLALSCLDGSRESPLNPASDGAPHAAKSSALWGAHVAYAAGLLWRGVDRAATARVVSLKHLQAQVRMVPPRRRTRAVTAGEPGHLHARRVARVSGTCPQLAKVIQVKPSTESDCDSESHSFCPLTNESESLVCYFIHFESQCANERPSQV